MAKKILIVDDSDTARLTVKNYLGGNFEVVEATDGLDALNKLQEIKDIDLLILDVNMPELDGIEVVQEMAKRDEIKKVWTIMLTTETSPRMKDAVRVHSFVRCWIIKPLTKDLLKAAIKKIFKE